MEEYILQILFKNKEVTPREYIAKNKEILIELEQFHPIFKNLFGWGSEANSRKGFKEDKSDFEEIVFKQIHDKEIVYFNENPNDKEMNLDSKSRMHYTNIYSNVVESDQGKVSVDITYGNNKDEIGVFSVKFPKYHYPEFSDYDFVYNLLIKCMSFFETYYAFVGSYKFVDLVELEDGSQDYWIGWMNYINNKEVYDLLPHSIQKKKLEGGTFFSLCKNMPTIENKDIIRQAIAIRDILGVRKLLNYPNGIEYS